MAKGIHDERYRSLIDRLVARRKELGLSQTSVAERLKRRQQYVSKYESRERRLDPIEFADIADALGLKAPDLLADIPIPTSRVE